MRSMITGAAGEGGDRHRRTGVCRNPGSAVRARHSVARFLICAESGGADALITGDGDFSEARLLIGAPIMNVREFAERFAPELIAV